MALTDLKGIGEKTAEKLKRAGITSERELAEARRRGDGSLREFGSRVQKAARDAGLDTFGEFDDPMLGVTVREDNRSAVETFAQRDTSDINDAGRITRNNPSIQGESLLELGRKATQGAELVSEMGRTPTQDEITETIVTRDPSGPTEVDDRDKKERRQTRRNIAEMGFDVAANMANVDRQDIKEANEIREEASPRGRKDPKTAFTETYTSSIAGEEKEFERDLRVNPREYAAAKRVHQARSPMAKRVDSRRRAETVTGDYDEWIEDPSQTDFAGVDTPEKGREAGKGFGFSDKETGIEATVAPRGGFQVKETSTDGGGGFGRIEESAGTILSAPQEQQRLVLNDLIPDEERVDELGLEPRGPDEDFFFGDAEGDFI